MIAEPFAVAGQVGLTSSRLKRINTLMQAFIDREVIAGGVTLLARQGRIAHLEAHGHMNLESGREMRTDTLFRLASMTKPVISVAILMLLEEGKLLLTDPVAAYVPSFKDLQVAVPNSASPREFGLEPAHCEITLKDSAHPHRGAGQRRERAVRDGYRRGRGLGPRRREPLRRHSEDGLGAAQLPTGREVGVLARLRL